MEENEQAVGGGWCQGDLWCQEVVGSSEVPAETLEGNLLRCKYLDLHREWERGCQACTRLSLFLGAVLEGVV